MKQADLDTTLLDVIVLSAGNEVKILALCSVFVLAKKVHSLK
jgi:hypothetical protein